MTTNWTTVRDAETIYAPGYSQERLEQEDSEKKAYLADHWEKYNRMLSNTSRAEKNQLTAFIFFICCFPEAALWGWVKFFHTPLVLIVIILQAVACGISLWNSAVELENLTGEIE